MANIPKEFLRLLHTEGFLEAYYEESKACSTCILAYEKTDNLHYEWFGFRKYSCYKSFINSRTVFLSRKRREKQEKTKEKNLK